MIRTGRKLRIEGRRSYIGPTSFLRMARKTREHILNERARACSIRTNKDPHNIKGQSGLSHSILPPKRLIASGRRADAYQVTTPRKKRPVICYPPHTKDEDPVVFSRGQEEEQHVQLPGREYPRNAISFYMHSPIMSFLRSPFGLN